MQLLVCAELAFCALPCCFLRTSLSEEIDLTFYCYPHSVDQLAGCAAWRNYQWQHCIAHVHIQFETICCDLRSTVRSKLYGASRLLSPGAKHFLSRWQFTNKAHLHDTPLSLSNCVSCFACTLLSS